MCRYGWLCFWLALGLSVELCLAAEPDYMPMRGDAGNGKTGVNTFQAPWRSLTSTELKPTESTAAVQPRMPETPSTVAHNSYLEWKNSCAPLPQMVAGQPLEMGGVDGFAHVAPYIDKPFPEMGFFDLLAEQLTGGETYDSPHMEAELVRVSQQ